MEHMISALRPRSIITVEIVAKLWDALLWAPIAVRVAECFASESPHPQAEFQQVWEATANLRSTPATLGGTRDDGVIDRFAQELAALLEQNPRIRSVDSLCAAYSLNGVTWTQTMRALRTVVAHARRRVFVLVDSLEEIGEVLQRIDLSLRGLFHLVGKSRFGGQVDGYRIQCCFPSELWPVIGDLFANPVKDLSNRLVLQWKWHDLAEACDRRMRTYISIHHSSLLEGRPYGRGRFVGSFLPEHVTTRTRRIEETVPYLLRHTQLLPRQVLYVFNECIKRAVKDTGGPFATPVHVVDAVAEVEATLCPEVFRAHSFRYPCAKEVVSGLVPRLPFRFTESQLHKEFNRSGLKKRGHEYPVVRQLLADCGVVGRFLRETDNYHRAEFAYTVEGDLILSPQDEMCLHPMFARQFSSTDLRPGGDSPKPVYPTGTPSSVR